MKIKMKMKIKTCPELTSGMWPHPFLMKMKMKMGHPFRPFFIFILIFILIKTSPAQPLEVNLESVLQMAGANNLTIQTYQLQQQLAADEVTSAKGWWLPEIYAGLTAHQRNGAAMNTDGRIFTGLNRQNLWAGLGATGTWDFAGGKNQVRVAEIRAEAVKYQTEAARTQVLLEVIESYFDFLSAQMEFETYSLLIGQADTLSRQLEIQAEAGLGYSSDVLLAQSNIRHLQIEQLEARSVFFQKMARLTGLLNLPPNTELRSTETQMTPLNLVSNTDLPDDLTPAYSARPELKYLETNVQALQMEQEGMKKSLAAPELQVGVNAGTFGDVFSPQRPTFEANAGLLWRIPLDMVFPEYQGEMKKLETQVAIQKLEMEVFKNEVNEDLAAAKWQMETASRRMEISREGSDMASQAFGQSMQRQQVGTARPFEILQAQEMYIQSQLDYLRALTEFNQAQYRLYVALGNKL